MNGADEPAKRVVVGVATWTLPEGSSRIGQFVVSDVGDPEPALNRDLCERRLEIFSRTTEAAYEGYFPGKMICDKPVVHPSYQHRGHATFMLQWGLRLSDMDNIDQGVIPSHRGEPLYVSLGYKVIDEIRIPDDSDVEGFFQRVVV